jgi:hypothetical protein
MSEQSLMTQRVGIFQWVRQGAFAGSWRTSVIGKLCVGWQSAARV